MFYPKYFNKKYHWKTILFLPIAFLVYLIAEFRRALYKIGILKTTHFDVVTIVVGNIFVGGVGKTPLVILLASYFSANGYNVGIVSRGYGANSKLFPRLLQKDDSAGEVGDEPLLIARRTKCPVVIDPNRVNAVRYLLSKTNVDIVIADDGLQHFALGRDIDILVEQANQEYGNRFIMPAGPLRESLRHRSKVDLIIENRISEKAHYFSLSSTKLFALEGLAATNEKLALDLDRFQGAEVNAIAGIAHPEKFFSLLEANGIIVNRHRFADHHSYRFEDFKFEKKIPIVMTEKDAVKCSSLELDDAWYVRIEVETDKDFMRKLDKMVKAKIETY